MKESDTLFTLKVRVQTTRAESKGMSGTFNIQLSSGKLLSKSGPSPGHHASRYPVSCGAGSVTQLNAPLLLSVPYEALRTPLCVTFLDSKHCQTWRVPLMNSLDSIKRLMPRRVQDVPSELRNAFEICGAAVSSHTSQTQAS